MGGIKKIRMLRSLANPKRSFPAGAVLRIGEDIDEAMALSWLACGVAEQDKILEGPAERKEGYQPEHGSANPENPPKGGSGVPSSWLRKKRRK